MLDGEASFAIIIDEAQSRQGGRIRAAMTQAIQEGFILDVLAHYTPAASYYRLAKTVEDDPEFDARRAQKKLRRFVEGSDHAISLKYVDKTLAGVRADEQTVADVVPPASSMCAGRRRNCLRTTSPATPRNRLTSTQSNRR